MLMKGTIAIVDQWSLLIHSWAVPPDLTFPCLCTKSKFSRCIYAFLIEGSISYAKYTLL